MITYSEGLDAFASDSVFLALRRIGFFLFFWAAGDLRGVFLSFSFWGSGPNPKNAPGNVRAFAFAAAAFKPGAGRPGRFLPFFRPRRGLDRLPRAVLFK